MRVNAIFILMSIQWAVLLYTLAFIIQENIFKKKQIVMLPTMAYIHLLN